MRKRLLRYWRRWLRFLLRGGAYGAGVRAAARMVRRLGGKPGSCSHTYVPTKDGKGRRVWVCWKCGHTKR